MSVLMQVSSMKIQLALVRRAPTALPTLPTAIRFRAVAFLGGRSLLLEGAAGRPQSAPNRIAACPSAAPGEQSLQSPLRDLRAGADFRRNPIRQLPGTAASAHPLDRSCPLLSLSPSRNARNGHIEQARNCAATPAVGARRNHPHAKINRIGLGFRHTCRLPRRWPQ